ncbi:putative repA4 protein, partial [Escherichia coli 8.0586]
MHLPPQAAGPNR